jgi:hypothetical protein
MFAAPPAVTVAPVPHLGIALRPVGGYPDLIGDKPGTTGWSPGGMTTAPWGEYGNDVIAPGTSASFPVDFVSTANVPEKFGISQTYESSWVTAGYATVPANWVTFTAVPDVTTLQPGQTVVVEIKVTVPANAAPTVRGDGFHEGLLQATASLVNPPKGVTSVQVGAGDQEFIRVGTPS